MARDDDHNTPRGGDGAQGGAGPSPPLSPSTHGRVMSLNLNDERDRGLLRRMVTDAENGRRPWPEPPDDLKAQCLLALNDALQIAREKNDHRGIKGVVETAIMVSKINQTERHKAVDIAMYDDKNARIDSGQATEAVVFNISPVEKREAE